MYFTTTIGPVSILNFDREISYTSVINVFPTSSTNGPPILFLRCLSSDNNPHLIWETQDQSLSEVDAFDIPFLTITYNRGVGVNNRDVFLTIDPLTTDTSGYYTCRSTDTNSSITSFVTLTQPYWEVVSPRKVEAPIGAQVSIRVLYADLSDGAINSGMGFFISVTFVPSEAESGGMVNLVNSFTDMVSNDYVFSFIVAGVAQNAGTYTINGKK